MALFDKIGEALKKKKSGPDAVVIDEEPKGSEGKDDGEDKEDYSVGMEAAMEEFENAGSTKEKVAAFRSLVEQCK